MTREETIKHFEAQAQCNYRPFSEAALKKREADSETD